MTDTLTIDEIVQLHDGEWILMRVTEYDQESWPLRGHVLAHAPRQEDLLSSLEREVAAVNGSAEPVRSSYCSFRAFPVERSGPEVNAAVAALAAGLIVGTVSDE